MDVEDGAIVVSQPVDIPWRQLPAYYFGKRPGVSWAEVVGSYLALFGSLFWAFAILPNLVFSPSEPGVSFADLTNPVLLAFAAMTIAGWWLLVRGALARRRKRAALAVREG